MLNFNTQPYYDDFDENKNFHRVLFKPGVAVQARELTQAQSILQDQIGKFGKFVLSDGSNVSGGKYSIDTNTKSLKLQDFAQISTDIEHFTNMFVVGETSRCLGLITNSDILNYYITVQSKVNAQENYKSGETLVLFSTLDSALRYTLNDDVIIPNYTAKLAEDTSNDYTGCSGQINSYTFSINATLNFGDTIIPQAPVGATNFKVQEYIITEVNYDGTFRVNKPLTQEYSNSTVTVISKASNLVLQVSFSEGVYFTNNAFVKALPQSVIPNNTTQYPTCVVGYEVQESIVDFIDDTSLLDPAQGSYNYTAPGADRYKIYLNLVSKPILNGSIDQSSLTTEKFIELLRIRNGIVVYDNTSPTLGGLEDVLAKQMYDHAGNFIISPFDISFGETDFSDNSTKLIAEVAPGRAYVFGYPFNATYPTYFDIPKARDTASSLKNESSTYYGNSIRISDLTGKLPIPTTGAKIELHSANIPNKSAATKLGYAYVRNIDYTTTNEYSLYLYNVGISETQMATVNSISFGTFSANTIQSAGKTVVTDAAYGQLLFQLPYSNAASITNARIILDKFDTIPVNAQGVATISTGSLQKQFSADVSSSLANNVKTENFIIVAKTTNGPYTEGQYVDLTSSSVVIKVEKTDTQYKATITFTNGYTGQIDIKYSIIYTNATAKTKTLIKDAVSQVDASTVPTSIGYSDVVKFTRIYKATNKDAKLIVANNSKWSGSISYDKYNVIRLGSDLYMATSDSLNSSPISKGAPWVKLEDSTALFKTDNGQRDYMYDHGTIAALSKTNTGVVFVLFDYYTHSSDGEYIAFNSYTGSIPYNQIPSVKINNTTYDLKNYVDFRPRRKDKPTDGSAGSEIILYDSYAIPTSITNPKFIYDMTYYKGRIDKLFLTTDKKLIWKSGESSYRNYVAPNDLPNAMTIATIQFDPYTLNQQAIKVSYTKHRRYTMDDIGGIDMRLKNVEYYTALSLGEKATLSTNIVDEYGTRLKNGFIVDPFTNFSIVDLTNNVNNIAFDLENNVARPSFKWTPSINLEYKPDVLTDSKGNDISLYTDKNVGIASFKYSEKNITTQDAATSYVKVNQFDKISYEGSLVLDPQSQVFNEQTNVTVNNINENTADIMTAAEVPGLVYDEWSKVFSGEVVEKTDPGVTVNYNNTTYNVSTKLTDIKTSTEDDLSKNIVPKTRSVLINFKATGLAPQTRMYVYVNRRLVNAYVKPNSNPTGMITGVKVISKGAGYAQGSTATLSGANTVPATFKLDIDSTGGISDVFITNCGKGYDVFTSDPLSLVISSTPTTAAEIKISKEPNYGTYLVTDKYGDCSGVLNLPNIPGVISFVASELVITISDTPHLDIENSISKAEATFYAKTRFYKETITSIRKPYITKVEQAPQRANAQQKPAIVVPTSLSYLTQYAAEEYSKIAVGVLTIPIYLNEAPTDNVEVSYIIDASEDKSQNTSITSTSASVFTFTPQNWSTIQELVIHYNLGDREKYTTKAGTEKWLDNNLPSHIEFYATSLDPAYSHPSTSLPIKSWLSGRLVTGVSSTHLVPYKRYTEKEVDAEGTKPFVYVSPIIASNVGGQSFFTVNYGGGKDIGFWSDSTNSPYPLTFLATADNDRIIINYSEYNDFETSNTITGGTRVINKYDNQILSFKYWIYGNKVGLSNVALSISSANPSWNSTLNPDLANIVVQTSVGAALLRPDAEIVVHPNIEIQESSGTKLVKDRITTSQGTTSLIGVTLSKPPTGTVTVKANSSVTVGGGDIFSVSNNGITILSGNTVMFDTTNWDQMKTFVVSGTDDTSKATNSDVPYEVLLKATSSDSNFSGKTKTVSLVNKDIGNVQGEIKIASSESITTGNGSTVMLGVSLQTAIPPTNPVRVFCTSSDDANGFIITSSAFGANGILEFNSSNYKGVQPIIVKGAFKESGVDDPYIITCVPKEWDIVKDTQITNSVWNKSVSVPLKNVAFKPGNEFTIDTSRELSYTATPKGRLLDGLTNSWKPEFIIGDISVVSKTPGSAYKELPKVEFFDNPQSGHKLSLKVYVDFKSPQVGSDTHITKSSNIRIRFSLQRNPEFPDCFISQGATISPTDTTKTVSQHGEKDKGVIFPSTTPEGKTWVEVEFIGVKNKNFSTLVDYFTIHGIYYDAVSPGFTVFETIKTTEIKTEFRTDNYATLKVYDPVIDIKRQEFPNWKTNQLATQAVAKSLAVKFGEKSDAFSPDIRDKATIPTVNYEACTALQAAFDFDTYTTKLAAVNKVIDKINEKLAEDRSSVKLITALREEQAARAEYETKLAALSKTITNYKLHS